MMRMTTASLLLALSAGAMAADAPADRREALRNKMQERIAAMDTNGDGNISREEFMAHAEKQFQRLDQNGDGQITPEERAALREKLGQRRGDAGFP